MHDQQGPAAATLRPEELMDLKHAAKALETSPRTLANLVHHRRIAVSKIGGRRFLCADQLWQFIQQSSIRVRAH